jgi:hypothetical protein
MTGRSPQTTRFAKSWQVVVDRFQQRRRRVMLWTWILIALGIGMFCGSMAFHGRAWIAIAGSALTFVAIELMTTLVRCPTCHRSVISNDESGSTNPERCPHCSTVLR